MPWQPCRRNRATPSAPRKKWRRTIVPRHLRLGGRRRSERPATPQTTLDRCAKAEAEPPDGGQRRPRWRPSRRKGGRWRLLAPEVLEEGERDHRQQRVMVQPHPRAPVEVVQAELCLELLVRLPADPARLAGRGQRVQRGLRRMVGQLVLALAGGTALAHQPNLVAGKVAAPRVGRPVRHAHAAAGELGREGALGAARPGNPPPRPAWQARERLLRRQARGRRHRVRRRAGRRLGDAPFSDSL
jgi:hypothetical protein